MREWLRQLSISGYEPTQDRAANPWLAPWDFTGKLANRLFGGQDFSDEVFEAMDGCLSCKACATQCPVEVDVPELKARFLSLYFGRYLRPVGDHLLRCLERAASVGSIVPRLCNMVTGFPLMRWALKGVAGIVDPPSLSHPNLARRLSARALPEFSEEAIGALSSDEKRKSVIVVQDAFTSFFDAETVASTVDLLQALGFRPFVAPFFPNGKAMHVKGFLHRFRTRAGKNSEYLRRLASLGVDLIGIEPAVALTYREEYRQVLEVSAEEQGFEVLLLQEWLAKRLVDLGTHEVGGEQTPFVLYGHCTEKSSLPGSGALWRQVFSTLGLELEERVVGCCGMCGVYGHEVHHATESAALFGMSWARRMKTESDDLGVLATGYSCRSQVARLTGNKVVHPATALARILRGRN
jgi:Fe-S oxidoreductase